MFQNTLYTIIMLEQYSICLMLIFYLTTLHQLSSAVWEITCFLRMMY